MILYYYDTDYKKVIQMDVVPNYLHQQFKRIEVNGSVFWLQEGSYLLAETVRGAVEIFIILNSAYIEMLLTMTEEAELFLKNELK